MAKLSNTSVYGDLNVSNTIWCKDLYIDRGGVLSSTFFSIGDVSSSLYFKVTSSQIQIRSTETSAMMELYNTNDSNGGLSVGYDATNEITMRVDDGSSDPEGVIEFGSDVGVGKFLINNSSTSSKRHIAFDLAGSNIMTISGDGVSFIAADVGSALKVGDVDGTGTSLTIDLVDGKLTSSVIEAEGTISATNSITTGSGTGTTTEDTRYYFGSGSSYIQRNVSNDDSIPVIGISENVNFLRFGSETEAGVSSDHGYFGPQMGWQPAWIDDFNYDTTSEYDRNNLDVFSHTSGYLVIEKNDTPSSPPVGPITAMTYVDLPLRKTLSASRGGVRYFVVRSLADSLSADETYFTGGTVYWRTSSQTGFTDSAQSGQNVSFNFAHPALTASTRSFYETWIDLNGSEETLSEIDGIRITFDNPDGLFYSAQTSACRTLIDYWGVGHRGYESTYSSSDYYNSGELFELEGDLQVSGDTSVSAMTASTVYLEHIDFDISHISDPTEGRLEWNDDDGTLNLGMPGGNVSLQVGQELIVRVRNNSGDDYTNGTIIYNNGSSGNKPTISAATADHSDPASQATQFGMLTEDIDNNSNGYVTLIGNVRGMNTIDWTEGTPLYLSTTAGTMTDVQPSAPNHTVWMGVVTKSHTTEGSVYFKPTTPMHITDLSDVNGTVPDATNKHLVWNNVNEYWDAGQVDHNETATLQGGATDEYYHLTQNEHHVLTGSSYNAHTADTTIHFTESSIDHGSIGGLTNDDHPQYSLSGHVHDSGVTSYIHLGRKTTNQDHGGADGTEVVCTWDQNLYTGSTDFTKTSTTLITCNFDGRVNIVGCIGCTQGGANRTTLIGKVKVGGVLKHRGATRNYSRGSGYGDLSVEYNSEWDVVSGDTIEFVTIVDDTDGVYTLNSILTECELLVRRLDVGLARGPQGDTGPTGTWERSTFKKMMFIEEPEALDEYPLTSVASATTIQRVTYVTDTGTVDFNLEKRAEATPMSAGTNIWSADETASSTSEASTTFNSSAIAEDEWLVFATSATTGVPTKLWINVEYTED